MSHLDLITKIQMSCTKHYGSPLLLCQQGGRLLRHKASEVSFLVLITEEKQTTWNLSVGYPGTRCPK